jgi:hypothetical protein
MAYILSAEDERIRQDVHNNEDKDWVLVINGHIAYTPEYYGTEEQARAGILSAFGDLGSITSIDLFQRVERIKE